MKKFPLALFFALVACAAYAFLSLFLETAYGRDPGIIGRLIFTGMLCTLLTIESYSKKEALILALGIGYSISLFYRLFFVYKYYEVIALDAATFLSFLIIPEWWMRNIWIFALAYFVLREGFNRRITQDNFFNN